MESLLKQLADQRNQYTIMQNQYENTIHRLQIQLSDATQRLNNMIQQYQQQQVPTTSQDLAMGELDVPQGTKRAATELTPDNTIDEVGSSRPCTHATAAEGYQQQLQQHPTSPAVPSPNGEDPGLLAPLTPVVHSIADFEDAISTGAPCDNEAL